MSSSDEKSSVRLKVLLIEDNPEFARLLTTRLSHETNPTFEVTHVESLRKAFQALTDQSADIVLMDLQLPDSEGLETFLKLRSQSPKIPVVIISGMDNESIAIEAVRNGAQDYVVKGSLDLKFIPRLMVYALERHKAQMELRNLSIYDDLTGLYNRRGLLTLGLEHLKLAKRTGRGLSFVYLDLDGLKSINDGFGHARGDLALKKAGELLKKTFRESDIIARLGGDEFGVLALEAPDVSPHTFRSRLQKTLDEYNLTQHLPFKIAFSMGVASFNPLKIFCVEQLIFEADKALYVEKKRKQKSPGQQTPDPQPPSA